MQIPLLEVGIAIHNRKKSDDLAPFHERLNTMFLQMKEHVEAKYGPRAVGPEFKSIVQGRHRKSLSRGSDTGWSRPASTSTVANTTRVAAQQEVKRTLLVLELLNNSYFYQI